VRMDAVTFETNRMNGNHAMRESRIGEVGSESVDGNEQNKNEY